MSGGGASAGGAAAGAGAGGAATGGGATPRDNGGTEAAGAVETILFRFYGDTSPAGLQSALKRVNGVRSVEIDAKAGTVSVTCGSGAKQLTMLESEAARSGVAAALVSHARMSFALAARKGADPKKFLEDAALVGGVRSIRLGSSSTIELVADLEALESPALREVAERCALELKPVSHEWVELAMGAAAPAGLDKSLLSTRGVLVVRASEGKLGMWTQKRVGDGVFKKLAEKAGAAISAIDRR